MILNRVGITRVRIRNNRIIIPKKFFMLDSSQVNLLERYTLYLESENNPRGRFYVAFYPSGYDTKRQMVVGFKVEGPVEGVIDLEKRVLDIPDDWMKAARFSGHVHLTNYENAIEIWNIGSLKY